MAAHKGKISGFTIIDGYPCTVVDCGWVYHCWTRWKHLWWFLSGTMVGCSPDENPTSKSRLIWTKKLERVSGR